MQKGCKEAVEALICGGVDLDIQDSDEKADTALIMAVKKDHTSIVKLLLHHGADYNKTNNAGEAFGTFAVSEEMINVVSRYDELTDLSIPSTSELSSRKRKTLSDISNSSSSESSYEVYINKHGKATNGSFLVHTYKSDKSSTTSSVSNSIDTLDISPPGFDISEPLVSKCRGTLQTLNLHYLASHSS